MMCTVFLCCNRLISVESKLRTHEVVSDEDDELVVELFSG